MNSPGRKAWRPRARPGPPRLHLPLLDAGPPSPKVSAWDVRKAGWWDRAVKGSSALQAALRRALVCELARLDGKAIHMPQKRAPKALEGTDYPEPIVDLKLSRQEAIDKFKSMST